MFRQSNSRSRQGGALRTHGRVLLGVVLFHLASPFPAPSSGVAPTAGPSAAPQDEYFTVELDLRVHQLYYHYQNKDWPKWEIRPNNSLNPAQLQIKIEVFAQEIGPAPAEPLLIDIVDAATNQPQVIDASGNLKPPWVHWPAQDPDWFKLKWQDCRLNALNTAERPKFKIRARVPKYGLSQTTAEFVLAPNK